MSAIYRRIVALPASATPFNVRLFFYGDQGCTMLPDGAIGGVFARVHNQTIKAARNATKPMHPTAILPAVESIVMDMSADNFSGDVIPDASSVLKLRIIPMTVPRNPTARPNNVSAPPEIIIDFKAGFIGSFRWLNRFPSLADY